MVEHKQHINLVEIESTLITGAGHGIGLALVKCILTRNKTCTVWTTYANKNRATGLFDLQRSYAERLRICRLEATKENDYLHLAEQMGVAAKKLDLLINCIGFLHTENQQPEKRLADIDPDHVLASFSANSLPTLLLAKHTMPFLKNQNPAVFAALSARVGSIADNRSGGWYSYRASKCALNMFIKNIALEFERMRCNTVVLSLHPGTTITDLSKPFIKNTSYRLHSPQETAENLLQVLGTATKAENGCFLDWQRQEIPW